MPGWRDRREQSNVSLDLWEILAEEFEVYGGTVPASFDAIGDDAIAALGTPRAEAARDAARAEAMLILGGHPRTALCFSGGGVRSATFGLGVMQGLGTSAFSGKTALAQFDYLSTVSGGGYLGGWFSAWAKRRETPGLPDGPARVEQEMQHRGPALDPDPAPLGYIRRYCAFLTPKLGLLSADAWTLVATVMRNMVLNWLILVPFIMAALLLPKMYRALIYAPPSMNTTQFMLYAGTVFALLGTAYTASHLPSFCGATNDGEGRFVTFALLPLSLGAVALSLHWFWMHGAAFDANWNYSWEQFLLYGAAVHFAGWILGIVVLWMRGRLAGRVKNAGAMFASAIAAFLSGLAAGVVGWLVSGAFDDRYDPKTWEMFYNAYACVAVPTVLTACTVAALLVVGLASKKTGDDDREWWARAGGWILIVIMAWIAATGTVLLGPAALPHWVAKLSAAAGTLGLGGIISWLGFSPATGGGRRGDKDSQAQTKNPIRSVATQLAAPVFVWVLAVVLAVANQFLLDLLPWPADARLRELLFFALMLAITFTFSPFINVNRFSLHAMYRDRLIRTYLGASRPDRRETVNHFTDFDEYDNLNLADLSKARPLHLVNMTLNLVGGANMAWQQRKAESFTGSRLRTGSLRVGYQNTRYYGGMPRNGTEGLSLGSAVAISGAAASPNMGYHSSPVLALIMTLFNARLGWWLANPGEPGRGLWRKEGPSIAFQPIVNEALGRTNDTSPWVYLSDGGHFENLGLYEMVLRRCRTIVVVDGSQDGDYTFEDLGNAIRKIRIDLGISIEFPDGIPIYSPTDLRNRYCGIAHIHYEEKDPAAACGTLLYIKACLNGTEPEDVLHYAAMNSEFPQQGTEQLWFDESQFESYRRLGLHIVEEIASAAPGAATKSTIDELMTRAAGYIASTPKLQHTNWPKSPSFTGAITGKINGPDVDLKAEITAE